MDSASDGLLNVGRVVTIIHGVSTFEGWSHWQLSECDTMRPDGVALIPLDGNPPRSRTEQVSCPAKGGHWRISEKLLR